MLDDSLKEQLQAVFSKLTHRVVLEVAQSAHSAQEELLEMLGDLGGTSDKITVRTSEQVTSDVPTFRVQRHDGTGGISFRGVPGGHEFSSLVLAVLHTDGKGKQPDQGIIQRIASVRGPVRLTTYVSLSCENCPEVVQALNLMAVHHPDFHHETVDGGIAQDEITRLGIQGVPCVMHEGTLLHSGKASLADLLATLETRMGRDAAAEQAQDLGTFDVAVIGGGPAGASSAIYSVRKGLKTALIADRFGGQLQETKGIENMISMSYTEGAKLSAQLGEHLSQYPVQLFEHRRVKDIADGAVKRITLESGEVLHARAVIIATGAQWRQLNIPGEKDYIGNGVAFCAHCDGPFYKGKRIAVVGGGNSGVEAALDLAGIVEHVTLLEFSDTLRADDVLLAKLAKLPNANVVVQAKSLRVEGDGRKVVGLVYEDMVNHNEVELAVDGIFVQIGLSPNSSFVRQLVHLTPRGEITIDPQGRTNIEGIYAAGDVTTSPFKQIVVAMGDGAKVALTAFEDRMRAP